MAGDQDLLLPAVDSLLPAAASERELLLQELGAILAGWGVADSDDELLLPIARSVAGLVADGPPGGE